MSLLFHLICWHGFINKNFKGWSPSARAVKAFSPSAFQWKAFRTPWFIRPKHLIKLSFSCVFISTSCLLLPPTHNHTHAADMSEAQWHSCAVQSDTSPLPLHLNIWCPLWEAQEVGNWGKPFYYHSLSPVLPTPVPLSSLAATKDQSVPSRTDCYSYGPLVAPASPHHDNSYHKMNQGGHSITMPAPHLLLHWLKFQGSL